MSAAVIDCVESELGNWNSAELLNPISSAAGKREKAGAPGGSAKRPIGECGHEAARRLRYRREITTKKEGCTSDDDGA